VSTQIHLGPLYMKAAKR